MNNKMIEALEICLQALERGETLDSALTRFPALAADLRPMLETSLHARTLSGPRPSDEVQRRARARLLQHAAEMREAKRAPRRSWLYNLRPLAVTLMLAIIFLSSTRLVSASSVSLPGDNLYPVKRTWEDVRLLFTFTEDQRTDLELTYESERQEEITDLLAEGRAEPVSFSGYVTAQTDGQWMVSGIPAIISAQTVLPAEPVAVGSIVTIYGTTNLDGSVDVHSIDFVPAGKPIPTPRPEQEEGEDGEGEGESHQETESNSPSENESGGSNESSSSETKSALAGVIESMNGNLWVINGQTVNVSGLTIVGTPAPGMSVTIEGYINESGVFVPTAVTIGSGGEGDGTDNTETESTQTEPKEKPEKEPPEKEPGESEN